MASLTAVTGLPARTCRGALEGIGPYAILALAALLLRVRFFGDPALHVDEQFYLLVGDRLLQGQWPYVDIWDRKPIGLFLVYAAIRLLGGSGILAYQIVATAFAAATAMFLYRIARFWTPSAGSIFAGLWYLAWLNMFQGWGGQSPVFYNLFVASAAWLTLNEMTCASGAKDVRRVIRRGAGAMLLLGLAIQIKYTVIFEGAAIGLGWLWCLWRARPEPSRIALAAAIWIAVALTPTALAWAVYAGQGHGDAFVYANFVSIFHKGAETSSGSMLRLRGILLLLGPAIILSLLAMIRARQAWADLSRTDRVVTVAAVVWLAAAVVGFVSVGNFYYHYTLPLLAPLAVIAVRWLPPGLMGGAFGAAVIVQSWIVTIEQVEARTRLLGEGRTALVVADAVKRHLKCGSLFVFDGPPVLYLLTGASAPTRFVFPYHLNMAIEADALGVDSAAETKTILAAQPNVIVTATRPAVKPNAAAWAIVNAELAAHYREVARIPYGTRSILVYANSASCTS